MNKDIHSHVIQLILDQNSMLFVPHFCSQFGSYLKFFPILDFLISACALVTAATWDTLRSLFARAGRVTAASFVVVHFLVLFSCICYVRFFFEHFFGRCIVIFCRRGSVFKRLWLGLEVIRCMFRVCR